MRGKLSTKLRRIAEMVADYKKMPWEAPQKVPARDGMGSYYQDRYMVVQHPECGKATYKRLKRRHKS